MLSWPTLGPKAWPYLDMGDPLTSPKRPKTRAKQPDFPSSTSDVISMPLYHSKMTMQSLCYLDLPWLCLGTLCHQSVTMGDPITAPKQPKTRSKQPDFPSSTSDVISMQSYHSKTTMQSLCNLNLPWMCLSTLCHPSVTMGDPLTSPKKPKTCPKQPDFP